MVLDSEGERDRLVEIDEPNHVSESSLNLPLIEPSKRKVPIVWKHQLISSIGCCFAGIHFGFCCLYTSFGVPSMHDDPDMIGKIDNSDDSWIASIVFIGALIGAFITLLMSDRIGRRSALIFSSLPGGIGWLMVICASDVWTIICGRLISGIAMAIQSAMAPMYLSETSPIQLRGVFSGFFMTSFMLACFVNVIIAMYADWRWQAMPGLVYNFGIAFLLLLSPDTHISLILRGKSKEAFESLMWFRGSQNSVRDELQLSLVESCKMEKETNCGMTWRDLSRRCVRMSFFLAQVLYTTQQMAGVMAVTSYSKTILENAGISDVFLAAIVNGFVGFLGMFSMNLIVDKFGRKQLFIISAFTSAASLCIIGVYFILDGKDKSNSLSWMAFSGLMLYYYFVSFGLGSIPWVAVSELLPDFARSVGALLSTINHWILSFVVASTFNALQDMFSPSGVWFIYAAFTVTGGLLILKFMPETKGRTNAEMINYFETGSFN